jgi:hypothetical protein
MEHRIGDQHRGQGRVARDGKENIEVNVIDYTLTKTEEAKAQRDQSESL